jgi:hypothetical protein
LNGKKTLTIEYKKSAVVQGALVYGAGDVAAMLILGRFSWPRLVGIMLVGATVYALEIPNYFKWIEETARTSSQMKRAVIRTALALIYFNPLWISRHLLFLFVAEGRWWEVNASLLVIGLRAWLFGIPAALACNYIIQVKLPLRHRFLGSAVFSALMAVYYAFSKVMFDD